MFKKIKRRFFPTKKEIAIDNVHRFFRADYAFIINLVVAVLFFIAGSYSQLHIAKETKKATDSCENAEKSCKEKCKSCIGFSY